MQIGVIDFVFEMHLGVANRLCNYFYVLIPCTKNSWRFHEKGSLVVVLDVFWLSVCSLFLRQKILNKFLT